MSSFEEINIARERLMEALGEKSKLYIQHMKLWFQMKVSKEDFDVEARKLLNPNQTHLHNQFLLHLFLQCSKEGSPSLSTAQTNQRTKVKRRARQHNGGFQATNPHEYLQDRASARSQEEPLRYCWQELFLPDRELVHMRFMLAAWELGLLGAEPGAAQVLVVAVQHFLKNILSVVLRIRNGFRIQERRLQYAMGVPVPNPWLRNTAGFLSGKPHGPALEVLETGEVVPSATLTPTPGEVQQDIACSYAASADCPPKRPVSVNDCFEALQIYCSAVPSNRVYTVSMERMAAQLYHPSWDDLGE